MQKHKIVVEGTEIKLVELTVFDRIVSLFKDDIIPWLDEKKEIFVFSIEFLKAILKERRRAEKILGHKISLKAFYKMWRTKWDAKIKKLWAEELIKDNITGNYRMGINYAKFEDYFGSYEKGIKATAEKSVSVEW